MCRVLLSVAALLLAGGLLHSESPPSQLVSRIQNLVAKGELAAARSELNDAIESGVRDPTVFNLKGVVEAQAGNYRDAEAAFQKAAGLAPRSTLIFENLGRLYQEHSPEDPQAVRKAIETYRKLLAIQPANGEGNFQLARLLAFQGAYAESESHLQRLPKETLAGPGALAVVCLDAAGKGEREKAGAAALRLVQHPDVAEADVVELASALGRARAAPVAAALLEGLAARGFASPATVRRLAEAYEDTGDFRKARETLEAFERREGVTSRGLVDLARVAFKQRDFEGALGYLAHARALEPRSAGIHFFSAIASIGLNLPVEAEKSLKEAIALDPSNPYYHYAMGAVKLQLQQPEDALPQFQAYLRARPEDPHGALFAGIARFQAQQDEEAAAELARAADRPETAAVARYFLGRIAMRQDDPDGAAREFERALAADPGYADAYAELGSTFLTEKRYPEAQKALRQALTLDPDHYRANLYQLTLYRRLGDPHAAALEAKFKNLRERQFENLKLLMRTIQVKPY